MFGIRRKIKNLFHHITPDILYQIYFNRLVNRDIQQLNELISLGNDLIGKKLDKKQQTYWRNRIDIVLSSPDNQDISRIKNAGKIIDSQLIMHNGIKVDPMSYYSFPLLQMMMENKGVHEPQEEKVFNQVLNSISQKKGKKTMLELGAYWSFYSMWFLKKFPTANCFMVEPERKNLFYGKRNFELNKMNGTFIHAGIDENSSFINNTISVDKICEKNKIEFLDILHSDIQGFEYKMLHGSERMLTENRIGYAFISTHSNSLHQECYDLLKNKYNFKLVASANLDESFSTDGVLVMKASNFEGIDTVEIANASVVNTGTV